MHKPDQGELQLDRSQLSYPEHLDLCTTRGSPAQNHKRPTTILMAHSSLANEEITGLINQEYGPI